MACNNVGNLRPLLVSKKLSDNDPRDSVKPHSDFKLKQQRHNSPIVLRLLLLLNEGLHASRQGLQSYNEIDTKIKVLDKKNSPPLQLPFPSSLFQFLFPRQFREVV